MFNKLTLPVLLLCSALVSANPPAPPAPVAPAVAPAPATLSWINVEKLTGDKLTFDVKNYRRKIKFSLKKKPVGKAIVFLQGNNLNFDCCAVEFNENDWDKPKSVHVTAAPYFTDSALDRNLNIRFAIQAVKDKDMNKKEDVLPVVREKGAGAICRSAGDPHYTSFGGVNFDFQGCGGPFSLVDSKRFTVQFTTKKWVNSAYVNSAIAIRYHDVVFILCADQGLTTFDPSGLLKHKGINGKPIIEVCQTKRGTDTKFRDYRFHFPDGSSVDAAINTAHMEYIDVTVKLPCHMQGKVNGLCGRYENPPNTKFYNAAGQIAPDLNAFGESYRIAKPENNLFVCAKPGGPKCANFNPHKLIQANACVIPPLKDTELPPAAGYEVAAPGYEVVENFNEYKTEVKIDPKPKYPVKNPAPSRALRKAAKAACHAAFKPYENDKIADFHEFRNNCIEDMYLSGQVDFVDQHRVDYLNLVRALTKPLRRDPLMNVAAAAEKHVGIGKKLTEGQLAAVQAVAAAVAAAQKHGAGRAQCPNDCSNRGVCTLEGCKCRLGWTGDACETDLNKYRVPREEAFDRNGYKEKRMPIVIPPPPIAKSYKAADRQLPTPPGGYVIAAKAGPVALANDPFADEGGNEQGEEFAEGEEFAGEGEEFAGEGEEFGN